MASYDISSDFQWYPEYDAVLEQIASTDLVHEEWTRLRDIIKFKLQGNISIFLDDPELSSPKTAPPFTNRPTTSGGLKVPPARPRARNPANLMVATKSFMSKSEANDIKESIFAQLHEFENNAPFTIQRLCELCVRPREHYKSVGKYLRAVEKTLLVTSTWESFPVPSEVENSTFVMTSLLGSVASAQTTPLFSPISFLHGDARTRSRSPPPLTLNEVKQESEVQTLGLVDELDDPRPGHLSDHPTAITTTTSLQDRFVRAESSEEDERQTKRQRMDVQQDTMMDENDDKENQR